MKKNIFRISIAVLLIAVVAACIFACNKEKVTKKNTMEQPYPSNVKSSKPTGTINLPIFKVTLHRSTTDRPRDHKYCGCEYCCGFCDFEWFPDLKTKNYLADNPSDKDHSIILFNILDKRHAKAYILEKKDYFEKEFGIDAPLSLPEEALKDAGLKYNSITIIDNEYDFIEKEEEVDFNGMKYKSFGSVIVDIDIL